MVGTPGVAGCYVIFHQLSRCHLGSSACHPAPQLLALRWGDTTLLTDQGQRPSGVSGSRHRETRRKFKSVGHWAASCALAQSLAKAAGVQGSGGVEEAGETQDQLWI